MLPQSNRAIVSEEERAKILKVLKSSLKELDAKENLRESAKESVVGFSPLNNSSEVDQKKEAIHTKEEMKEGGLADSLSSINYDLKNLDNDEVVLPKQDSKYYPLEFLKDPIDLLFYLEENFRTGAIKLYDWQVETNVFLSRDDGIYTKEWPLRFHLCAVNGSGKDAFVISVFSLFKILTKNRARVIITSSSFKQLNNQTEAYIRALANQVNTKLASEGICKEALSIKKQHIVCNLTQSEIVLFVTDEESKAEGYHPFPDYPNAEMWIIINEAKSITPKIYFSLRRCTGYCGWIEVSSPGESEGDFFEHCSKARNYPLEYKKEERYFRRITAYDCPHISKSEIEEAAKELPTEHFGMLYLGLFGSVGSQKFITKEKLDELFNNLPEYDGDNELAGGLDLSLGGDETTFVPRRGNKQIGLEYCKIRDPESLVEYIENWFYKHGFEKKSPNKSSGTEIFTDVGGLGLPIAIMLENRYWNIIHVNNQSPANNKRLYRNRVAEGYSNLGNFVNRRLIILQNDAISRHQLVSRSYEYERGIIKAEDKKECKARLGSSPDRADAIELCFKNFTPKKIQEEYKDRYQNSNTAGKNIVRVTQNSLLKSLENERFNNLGKAMGVNGITKVGNGKKNQRSWVEEQIKDYNNKVKNN